MTGINFLGAELAAKRPGLLRELVPGLLALPYSSIRTRHGVPSRYCETWKLLLALTPSSRHQLSRLAPMAQRDRTGWLGMQDSKCAGRPARSRWCKSTTMKE